MSESTEKAKLATKRLLLKPARFFNTNFAYMSRVEAAYARGALAASTRIVDPSKPHSWEFGAFSQNGEDGVIDHLLSLTGDPNRYFVEIGASDGLQNNTSYLAFVKNYSGLMVEGDPFKSGNAQRLLQPLNWAVSYRCAFLEPHDLENLVSDFAVGDPDFLSLDIDGNDFHVMDGLFGAGVRPKVACVEYNSAFGPDASVTIEYKPGFNYRTFHQSRLYYGVSIKGWRTFFERHGYRFVTVDSRGINAFFIDPAKVDLAPGVVGSSFIENAAQLCQHGVDWRGQQAQIRGLPLVTI